MKANNSSRLGAWLGLGAAALLLACASTAAAQAPDRSKPPAPGTPPDVVLPAVHEHALSSGLPVWVVEQHEVPVVRVLLVARAGGDTDPAGRFGAAAMMASMMQEGAGSLDSLGLADAVDFLGASLDVRSGMDSSSVSLGVPVSRLAQALPLMADVVQRPTFPAKELERLRQQALTGLLQVRDNPAALAARAFPRLVFGPTHRYGTQGSTRETLTALTVDDLKAAHARVFHPSHSLLVVVGDVTAAGVLPLLETHFGSWRGAGPAAAAASVPTAPQLARREIVIVDKPGAAQSQIRIGQVGVARDTPDFFAITVANTILGGAFTSRLNQNLRETHGYTYGASSAFDMRRSAGPFFAGAGVQTDKTAEAVKEFFNEFAAMQKPVPADELAKAKNYVALGYPGDFETTGDIASNLASLFVYGLPDDYPSRFVGRTLAVTEAEVAAVAKRHLDASRFVVLVVGDRAAIEAPLKALNLGPVRVMSVDEVMGETAAR
ncbi:MAG: insulinase family protein [Vicinamibacterales bacterium]|nr:insulinase family protein [Vicinamibacterales bacterium]